MASSDALRDLQSFLDRSEGAKALPLASFSRPRAQSSEVSDVDVRTLAREIVARARPHAEAKDIDLLVYTSSASVRVERETFVQAVLALLENAIEATRRGHPVVMDVSETREGGSLWQVQDTGNGSNASLGRQASFTRGVVETHGGALHVESSTGVGTTVCISLPAMP